MTVDIVRSLAIIAICAGATQLERALPFLIFRGREVPKIVTYLGRSLTMAIITTLVVYCMRDLDISSLSGCLPRLAACGVTALLHLRFRNTLLSIAGGTVTCMLLTQFVFV